MPEFTFRNMTVTIKRNTCCEAILCHPIAGQKHEIMLLGMLRTFDCFHHFIFYVLQAFAYIMIIVRVCQVLVVHIYNDIHVVSNMKYSISRGCEILRGIVSKNEILLKLNT